MRAVGRRRDAALQVQFAAVGVGLFDAFEGKVQVAQRLKGLLGDGDAEEVRVGQLLSLLEFAGEDQVADLWKIFDRFGVVVVVGAAGPEGAFVECDALALHAAKDHRAHQPVAHRQRLEPVGGGLAIPEHHVARGWRIDRPHRCCAEEQDARREEGK